MREAAFVIPYFEQPKLHLGPITIHAFGALVATGILLAFRLGISFSATRAVADMYRPTNKVGPRGTHRAVIRI